MVVISNNFFVVCLYWNYPKFQQMLLVLVQKFAKSIFKPSTKLNNHSMFCFMR